MIIIAAAIKKVVCFSLLFAFLVIFAFTVNAVAASTDPKLIESAKKEGSLVWWTTVVQDQAQPVIDAFMAKYPFMQATYWRSSGVALHNKMMTESRAGRHSWDVVNYGSETVTELRKNGIIAPYKSAERTMILQDMRDEEGYWTAIYASVIGLGFNTKQVKKEETPRTYNDLLHPRWKGKKISIDNEGESLLIGLKRAWGKAKAVEYLKQLATQEPVPGRGATQRTQSVAIGELPLLLTYTNTAEFSKSQGASIDWVNLEPGVVSPTPILLARQAPHPNAGKLFIDFMLSHQGQTVLQKLHRVTVRTDVKPIPPRFIEGFKRVVLGPEHFEDMKEDQELYRQIFGLP